MVKKVQWLLKSHFFFPNRKDLSFATLTLDFVVIVVALIWENHESVRQSS